MLNKIVKKSLLKSKVLLGSIFLLFTISMMLLSIVFLTYEGLEKNFTEFTKDNNAEEFRLYGVVDAKDLYTEEFIDEVESENDITLEEKNFYTFKQKDQPTVQVNQYHESDVVNTQDLVDGNLPLNEGEVFISQQYAEKNNLQVGDVLIIDSIDYIISGIGYLLEYSLPFDMKGGGLPGGNFSPIYMNETSYNNAEKQEEVLYYAAKFDGTAGARKDLVKSIPDEYEFEIPLLDQFGNPQLAQDGTLLMTKVDYFPVALDKDLNYPLFGFQFEINQQRIFFVLIAQVVIVLTTLLVIVLFDSVFKAQRREIGILKAEGILNNQLAGRFLQNLVYIILLSSVFGVVLGKLISSFLSSFLTRVYTFPIMTENSPNYLQLAATILLIAGVVLLLVYIFAIRKNLNMKLLNLIKNISSDKNPKVNIAKYTKKLSFKTKYRINIFIRNFGMTIMLSFGVIISTFLLLLGTLMLSSSSNMVNNTYTKMFTYDYMVNYSAGFIPEFDENSTISYNAVIENMSSDYEVAEDTTIPLYGFDVENNAFINLEAPNGGVVETSAYEEGLVMSSGLTNKYNLKIGDTIKVKNPTKEEVLSFEITGIVEDGFQKSAYMDIAYMQDVWGYNDNFSNSSVYATDKTDEILALDPEAKITSAGDFTNSMNQTLSALYAIIIVITVLSSAIAFITISTISVLVISNNRKTISVMKVLGYANKEIRSMTTSTYKWIVIVVYFGSIPIMNFLIKEVVSKAMREMDFSLDVNLNMKFVLAGFVVIYGIYYFSMLVAQRSISKIKLAESLKVDE